MELRDLIIEKIRQNGPISFREFMEMALYYPGKGYYASEKQKFGEKGDYYTNAYSGSIFGELLGKQILEMWGLAGSKTFTIVEYGAGTGLLCRDILNFFKENKRLNKELTYVIIEKSVSLIQDQKSLLPSQVKWIEKIEDIKPITGCIISNEVIDNFSVHKVFMGDELMEIFVDYDDGFREILKPAFPELKDYYTQLDFTLPRGYQAEINMDAIKWIKDVSGALKKGFVLTIDYGYTIEELHSADKKNGTILCYYQHEINDEPFTRIGSQDITSHVNFSALHHWGSQAGLEFCGFTTQSQFMHGLGLVNLLRKPISSISTTGSISFTSNFLMDLAKRLKILVQQKGLNHPRLSGLMFNPPGLFSLRTVQ